MAILHFSTSPLLHYPHPSRHQHLDLHRSPGQLEEKVPLALLLPILPPPTGAPLIDLRHPIRQAQCLAYDDDDRVCKLGDGWCACDG